MDQRTVGRGQDAPVDVDVEPLETRFLPRLIAGLSELGCAAWLWGVWLHPGKSGIEGVLAAFAVVVLEGPLLVCLAALFVFAHSVGDLRSRASSVLLFGLAAWVAISIAGHIVDNVQGTNLYLLGMIAGIFVGKWMLFLDGRRNNPGWEIGKLFIQFVVLVVCFGMATSFASRLGFDADTVMRLGVPERMDLIGRTPGPNEYVDGARFHTVWGVIAGGIFYFALYGVLRFVSLTRPARVRAKSRRSLH